MMSERQIKGIIAVCIILAFIPFIRFFCPSLIDSKSPVLSTSGPQKLIIEIVAENGIPEIYFVEAGTSVNQIFSKLALNRILEKDIELQNGIKIIYPEKKDHRGIIIKKMDASKRLALGIPLDINLSDSNELTLIPGVGEVMAANILAEREKIGRFERLDQLMNVKGIKEKKLSKLKKYFYVDKLVQ